MVSRFTNLPDGEGDCFDVAVEVARELHGQLTGWPQAQASVAVCHGIATGQGKIAGVRIAHAWVEYGGVVLDRSNGGDYVLPLDRYYAIGKINPSDVTRYSVLDALANCIRHGHYGPWD